ncbi:hypothetical protein OGATHE_003109 [Ogataea polymorpha]|uniref:Uncharacterized protein n=1 Tax=Ogataea polymorpha TaxID=460523 RepID=A0A9P8P9G3_9ASCO|nr:hypothetical protein OGATHE_003109 [Ogataea polymorpha]
MEAFDIVQSSSMLWLDLVDSEQMEDSGDFCEQLISSTRRLISTLWDISSTPSVLESVIEGYNRTLFFLNLM